MAGLHIPVELGAEFIHGEAEATHALLRRAGAAALESIREQRTLERGRLSPVNAFEEAQRAVQAIDKRALYPDVSFGALLSRIEVPEKTKTFARMMVEGFDAADPATVSARSIVEEWGEGGSLGASQPRPQGGYGPAFDWLAQSLVARGARLQLESRVHRIAWKKDGVSIEGASFDRPFTFKGRRAIVTLPLGVLQSRAVAFSPSLSAKRSSLRKLASGPVIRVAMRFHAPFWQTRAPGVAFFHVPGAAFPTFWTPLPMHAPLLTAWAGGPKAARLTGSSSRKLIGAAIGTVQKIFGRAIQGDLAAAYVQDWQADPFARGGYSYVRVGGAGAREELAAPVDDTLFFAGEATDAEEAGTVAGALRSGARAAREVLKML